MAKTFIINNELQKKLGEIIFSAGGFTVKISAAAAKRELKEMLGRFSREGIYDLGEVILKKPIKPSDPLFLGEVRNQLGRRGYLMIEKSK